MRHAARCCAMAPSWQCPRLAISRKTSPPLPVPPSPSSCLLLQLPAAAPPAELPLCLPVPGLAGGPHCQPCAHSAAEGCAAAVQAPAAACKDRHKQNMRGVVMCQVHATAGAVRSGYMSTDDTIQCWFPGVLPTQQRQQQVPQCNEAELLSMLKPVTENNIHCMICRDTALTCGTACQWAQAHAASPQPRQGAAGVLPAAAQPPAVHAAASAGCAPCPCCHLSAGHLG